MLESLTRLPHKYPDPWRDVPLGSRHDMEPALPAALSLPFFQRLWLSVLPAKGLMCTLPSLLSAVSQRGFICQ